MSTKFVSKNSNYMVVLRPGVEGSRALGTHAIPGLYVKFQSGVVDVKEESIAELLRAHPDFGDSFIEIRQEDVDPFLDSRSEIEPDHIISDIKYGHVEKTIGAQRKIKITPELKKILETEALKMIPGLLKSNPEVLKTIILGLAAEMKVNEEKPEDPQQAPNPEEVTLKRGPGRPPKVE